MLTPALKSRAWRLLLCDLTALVSGREARRPGDSVVSTRSAIVGAVPAHPLGSVLSASRIVIQALNVLDWADRVNAPATGRCVDVGYLLLPLWVVTTGIIIARRQKIAAQAIAPVHVPA